jgi:DNA-binding NarL/FixJ family response regulator
MPIRLLVVVDVRLYRDGIAATLAGRPAIVVVDAVGTRSAALAAGRASQPDVVLVDLAVDEALDLIRDIGANGSGAAAVAFAVDEATSDIVRCAEAGAAGYVTADASIEDLAAAIAAAMSGELKCPPRIAGELFRRLGKLRSAHAEAPHPFLTAREREVLDHLRHGLSNKEIGHKLCLAESTVKNHVHHVLEKLDVRTRAQAAARSAGREITERGRARSRAV